MTLDDDEIEEILDKGDVTNLFSTKEAKRKECEAIETRNNEIQEASDSSNNTEIWEQAMAILVFIRVTSQGWRQIGFFGGRGDE